MQVADTSAETVRRFIEQAEGGEVLNLGVSRIPSAWGWWRVTGEFWRDGQEFMVMGAIDPGNDLGFDLVKVVAL